MSSRQTHLQPAKQTYNTFAADGKLPSYQELQDRVQQLEKELHVLHTVKSERVEAMKSAIQRLRLQISVKNEQTEDMKNENARLKRLCIELQQTTIRRRGNKMPTSKSSSVEVSQDPVPPVFHACPLGWSDWGKL